jgi:effector-binding domain-containing protein
MASNIISGTIDGSYPVAGVDNNTQGFRDNFTIIKTGMATAASEITSLQSSTAKLNASNDFNGSDITDANFSLNTEKYHNIGTVVTGQNISFLNGPYQSASVNLAEGVDTINFTLADWPDRDHVAKITLQLRGNDTAKNVTFTVEGGGTIKKNPNYPSALVVESNDDPIVVEFWTYNQGTTIYASYLGKYTDVIGGSAGTLGDTIIEGDLTVTGNINKPITTTVTDINDIVNVNITSVADGQVLKWSSSTSNWINASDSDTTTILADINDITNVDITSISNGQVLVYNSAANAWVNQTNALVSSSITVDGSGRLKTGIASDDNTVIVESTTGKVTPKLFEVPQYSSTERDGTSGLSETGSIIWNTTTTEFQAYGNGAWSGIVTRAAEVLSIGGISTAERNALTPVAGDIVFNSSTNKHEAYDGSLWNAMY